MPKKTRTDDSKPADGPNPFYYEQEYTPSGMIGKMLGLHPKYPEPNQEGKGDLPKGVELSDIRSQYAKKGKRK